MSEYRINAEAEGFDEDGFGHLGCVLVREEHSVCSKTVCGRATRFAMELHTVAGTENLLEGEVSSTRMMLCPVCIAELLLSTEL